MEISTENWHRLSEFELKEIKTKIDDEYSRALTFIWLRAARQRLDKFDDIVPGSVIQVLLTSIHEYAVVTGSSKRGLGFSCWFLDGSTKDVPLDSVISHEVSALLTPLSSVDKTPLPKAIEELKSKYQEDVFE